MYSLYMEQGFIQDFWLWGEVRLYGYHELMSINYSMHLYFQFSGKLY